VRRGDEDDVHESDYHRSRMNPSARARRITALLSSALVAASLRADAGTVGPPVTRPDAGATSLRGDFTFANIVTQPPVWQPTAVRFLRQRSNAFRFCYERALEINPTLSGRLEIHAEIAASGRVANAEVHGGAFSSSDVPSCAAAAVRQIVFPAATTADPRTLEVTLLYRHRT
jgi:hypothetical protein